MYGEKNIKSECEFIGIKNNRLNYRYQKYHGIFAVNELIEKFANTYKFCNGDLNKFVLLLTRRCLSLWLNEQLGKI